MGSLRIESPSSVQNFYNELQQRTQELNLPRVESLIEDDDEEDDDEWDEDVIYSGIDRYQNLLQATGSEIVQTELQQQMAQGPRQFLQHYGAEASELEQMAMRTITEQLPMTAVRTFATPRKSKDKSRNNLNFETSGRVSVEEEVQLAQMIQKGVWIQSKKRILEETLGRPISRAEWAQAVELSPKELRRTIAAVRTAKHQLVMANIGLVHAVVKPFYTQYVRNTIGMTMEELVQEGSLGLLRAAELFDPSRGVRFSTYAVVWIKGLLSNSHVLELVRLPSREKAKYQKILKAQKDIEAMNGGTNDSPIPGRSNLEEISSLTGLSIPEIMETQRLMNQASHVMSLDQERVIHNRSGTESRSMDGSRETSNRKELVDEEDFLLRMQLHTDVIAFMARNLDEREARLMRLRYGLSEDGHSRTLHECADAMGLSYTRVHQLNARCLQKLRHAAEAESLEEYLLSIA
jgi:RNA polymerase sigma factor (sigma-70 family)